MLPLFIERAALAPLEQAWQAGAELSLQQQLQLAWGRRQRAPQQVLRLCNSIESQLQQAQASETPQARASVLLRLLLIRAEFRLLQGELEATEPMLALALAQSRAQHDLLAQADAYWLRYYWAADLGKSAEVQHALQQAITAAESAGDASRALLFRASLARALVFVNPVSAEAQAAEQLPQHSERLQAMEAAALEDFWGLLAGMNGDFAQALVALTRAHDLALSSGQIRRALTLATNLGHTYSRMGEFASAMNWLERALALARQSQWPNLASLCLAHAGEALRRQGRKREAREYLQESLQLSQDRSDSRNAALALDYLGHTELDCAQPEAAWTAFTRLLEKAEQAADLQIKARLGLARAELMRGGFGAAQAQAQAQAGLNLALQQVDKLAELEFLWVLADIAKAEAKQVQHAHSELQVLKLYLEALQRAEAMSDHVPEPLLLENTAQAFAACGSYERAYHLLCRAGLLRQSRQQQERQLHEAALRTHHQLEIERHAREQQPELEQADTAGASGG